MFLRTCWRRGIYPPPFQGYRTLLGLSGGFTPGYTPTPLRGWAIPSRSVNGIRHRTYDPGVLRKAGSQEEETVPAFLLSLAYPGAAGGAGGHRGADNAWYFGCGFATLMRHDVQNTEAVRYVQCLR